MIEKHSCQDDIPVLGATIGDFWSWAYSDILNNANRAVFAEIVVGTALGVTTSPSIQWDAVDLHYKDEKDKVNTIEVNSAAYIQGWEQQGLLSRISFDVAERVAAWASTTDNYVSFGLAVVTEIGPWVEVRLHIWWNGAMDIAPRVPPRHQGELHRSTSRNGIEVTSALHAYELGGGR